MSNIAIFNPTAARPSYAIAAVSSIAKALAGGGSGGKRLSVKGGVFRLMVDGKEVTSIDDRFLDIVIVNAAEKVNRTFYAGAYVEGQAAAPVCWSTDGSMPANEVKRPQFANCANCPQNAKGSGQGDSRACRYNQQLAIVLANDQEGDVMQLTLAATSIFGKPEGENTPLQEYVRFHMAQGNDITQFVTRLRFDTKVQMPKLFFKAMRWLSEDEWANAQTQGQSAEAIKAITMTVSQMDGVAPAVSAPAPMTQKAKVAPVEDEEPPAPAPKAKAKATPAPLADDEEPPAPAPKAKAKAKPAALPDDEPVAEPVVRKTATPASSVVAATNSLAATLAAWDDE